MRFGLIFGMAAALIACSAAAEPVHVSTDNFARAESDLFLSNLAKGGSFGKMKHTRQMAPIDKQPVVRLNRDTLYSGGIFDLDAGPVTITIPEAGKRFISMQIIDQNQYSPAVYYKPGEYTLTREQIGTRYVLAAIRVLANPDDPADLAQAHKVQDGVISKQEKVGVFEIPDWDEKSRSETRAALTALGDLLPDNRRMFGPKDVVDQTRHLIGTAIGWGGNPDKDAVYLSRIVPENDGATTYRLKVGEVPVEGFWSISVYNATGYFEKNDLNAYTINNITAARDKDGGITVQFGNCTKDIPNCLPTPKGWNYTLRLYRPSAAILDGSWTFPEAVKVQ